MRISIHEKILKRFPETKVGVLLAKVQVLKMDPQVEVLKENLLEIVKGFGIDANNIHAHPNIELWRRIYQEEFKVNPNKYPSAIESLVKRIISGKPLWNISNIVDLYNCIAVQNLMPMGAYDMANIEGDICLRYAEEGESFQALGSEKSISVRAEHIIYSDNNKVLTWLWNHKDSFFSGVTESTQLAIFFVDSIGPTLIGSVENTIALLKQHLESFKSTILQTSIICGGNPMIQL